MLRGELGYRGLIVSDDLEMKAIADHHSIGGAAVQAITAGCDLVLVCRHPARASEARVALAEAAERDPGFREKLARAAQRVNEVRKGLRCAPLEDPAQLSAALAAAGAEAVSDEIASRL